MSKDLSQEEVARVRAAEVITKYWKSLAAIGVVALVGIAAYWGITERARSENRKVRAEIYKFEKPLLDKEKSLYDAAVKTADAKKDPKKKDASMDLPEVKKDEKTYNENYQQLAADLEQAILQHKNSEAAVSSAISLADFYVEYGQTEKAKNLLRQMVEAKSGSNVLAGLLKSQLGGLLMTKESCKEAIELFNGVLADTSLSFLQAPVLARRAACHIELGEMTAAEADITKVKTDYADSEAARQVDTMKLIGLARGTKAQ